MEPNIRSRPIIRYLGTVGPNTRICMKKNYEDTSIMAVTELSKLMALKKIPSPYPGVLDINLVDTV